MEYKPKEGQDIFDVSLQLFGSVEAGLFALVTGSSLKLDASNLFGEKITLNNNIETDKKVVSFFSNNNFTPTNFGYDSVIGDFNNDFNNDFY